MCLRPTEDAGSGGLKGGERTTKEIEGNVNSDATVLLRHGPSDYWFNTPAKPDENKRFSAKFSSALNGKKRSLGAIND